MTDNNNYDAEKEIMKINNISISKEEFEEGIDEIYKITNNIMYGNDKIRDYKQLNINSIRNTILYKINNNMPCSILNGINENFINREENRKTIQEINEKLSGVFEAYKKQLEKHKYIKTDYDLDTYEGKSLFLFKHRINSNNPIIESLMNQNPNAREMLKPLIKKLIENVNKNEIDLFGSFLEESNLLFLKNTVNSERLLQENDKIKEIFGVESEAFLTNEQRKYLDEKLTNIQAMKDEFNRKLSEMTPDMIEGNKNKLLGIQTNIMALEDMTVLEAGFDKLGLFTSDITNAVSNHEMNRIREFFNTAEIDDSKREKVINDYKGEERVKEYKKLMMTENTLDYEILELVPKWYNMIHNGAKTEEAIVSFKNEISSAMDEIKGGGNDDGPK